MTNPFVLYEHLENKLLEEVNALGKDICEVSLVMEDQLYKQGKVGFFWLYTLSGVEGEGGTFSLTLEQLGEFGADTGIFSWAVKQLNKKYGDGS